jgi:hypothetical protein
MFPKGTEYDDRDRRIVASALICYAGNPDELYPETECERAYELIEDLTEKRDVARATFREWNKFQTFLQQRHDIIHPTDDLVPAIDTDTAVDGFNLTVDLILGHFDLVWRETN